jgi:hypothetical protein
MDGSYMHVLDRGQLSYDAAGRPVAMVGLLVDVSDRMEAAAADAQRVGQGRLAAARQLHAALDLELESLELLAQAAGRLRREGKLEALAQALAQLLGDPLRRQAMGQAGRRRVENEYTWERVVAQMLPHIQRVALENQRAPGAPAVRQTMQGKEL